MIGLPQVHMHMPNLLPNPSAPQTPNHVVELHSWVVGGTAKRLPRRLLCGARRLFCLGSAAKIWVAPCSPNGPQPFCMAIGVGNGGLGRKFSWGKNTYVRRLHFCNRHFFWQQGFLKTQNRGFQVCFLPPQPCSSLLNGPVCCPQHPV